MGIVRVQGFYSSIFIYLGFIIGAFNLIFLFGKYFTPEQIGLTRIITDLGVLLASFSSLGSIAAVNKFYPFYNSYLEKDKNDLPFLAIIVSIVGFLLVWLLVSLNSDYLIKKFSQNSPLFIKYYKLIFPFAFCFLAFSVLEPFIWAAQKTIVSNIAKETLSRFFVTIISVLFIWNIISFDSFAIGYSLMYLLSFLLILFILIKHQKIPLNFRLSKVTYRLGGKILNLSIFVFVGGVFGVLAKTVDTLILSSVQDKGLEKVAIFAIATYFVTLMDVPLRGIVSITIPVMSNSWKNKDYENIKMLYRKSALNLLIAGLAIFIPLWLNISNIVKYLGSFYEPMKWVVFTMGFAKLVDLGSGVNNYIIGTSKFWKFDFITYVVYVVLSLPLNYLFIKKFGLMGGAIANLISLVIFNTMRFVFILKKFKMQPFTSKNLMVIFIAILSYLLFAFMPFMINIYFDSVIRTLLFLLVFLGIILRLEISEDITILFNGFKNRFILK